LYVAGFLNLVCFSTAKSIIPGKCYNMSKTGGTPDTISRALVENHYSKGDFLKVQNCSFKERMLIDDINFSKLKALVTPAF
jgi:hypothetical protein